MLVVPIPFPCHIQYSFPHVDMSVPLSIGVSSIRPPSLSSTPVDLAAGCAQVKLFKSGSGLAYTGTSITNTQRCVGCITYSARRKK